MRHSHRDILTTSDVNYALRVRNVEVIIIINIIIIFIIVALNK